MSRSFESLPEFEQKFIQLLQTDYPEFRFCLSKRFSYRSNTIFLGQPQPYFALQTLHELGHALNHDVDYSEDVVRLKIESRAWQTAKRVYKKYKTSHSPLFKDLEWDQDFVEDSLDTYRNWLHQKSTCPSCGLTRYQTKDNVWHCPICDNFR